MVMNFRNISKRLLFVTIVLIVQAKPLSAQSRFGVNDTLITGAVVYEGDTIPAMTLPGIYVWRYKKDERKWTRLRNAVYVTYPYARKAGIVFTDIERNIANKKSKAEISRYINSRERDLKKEFTEPLKNLSIYQGKILMKLINRETGGTNCYDILKELKGGFTARFWQTIAFVFGSDLKQPYDAYGKDADIESIVQEVQRMYGYAG